MSISRPKGLVWREYRGLEAPPGVSVPTAAELLKLCTEEHEYGWPMGLAYPPEAPVFWIKYGYSVRWNEVPAQTMAYHELRKLGSPVRVPGIFYACTIEQSYIVMEYIPGKTAAKWLELEGHDTKAKKAIYERISAALHELHRIPIPPNSRPAAISGGLIQHALFDMQEAPRHYENVGQLEEHLQLWLKITKRTRTIEGLTREPMVFCYSDSNLRNFIIGDGKKDITVVDFAAVSILPSSFSKFAIAIEHEGLEYDIVEWVKIPSTEGVDNKLALLAANPPMVMGPGSFAKIGQRIEGYEWSEEQRKKELQDYYEAVARAKASLA